MKQVFQDLKDGSPALLDIPIPFLRKNEILVRSICSLISPGTEGMIASFGKANMIEKARQQPEKVKEVINKISTDGLIETYEAVKQKIEEPIPLGYSNVGEIIDIGEDVKGFKIGDRVASNGPHAEIFSVNQNLCAVIPDNVRNEDAVFTVIASIGLNGIRLAKPSFGETFLVSGLGLIGLITSQILISNGCTVLGVDPDEDRCNLASSFGVESLNISRNNDQVSWCLKKTQNLGIDGAIITAAVDSSDPINYAAKSCRKRGRIILIGATPINLIRDIFYKKELSFNVSCSYGPGRYDKSYEVYSNDYPIGYVRWTEKRNFEAILNSFAKNSLKIKSLISHTFEFDNVKEAYNLLLSEEKSIGILINYPYKNKKLSRKLIFKNYYEKNKNETLINNEPFIGFIGSGNYAKRILIPSFSKAGAKFHSLISPDASSSIHIGRKFLFPIIGTDINEVFNDINCNSVVIATRHDSHCEYIIKALEKGKNIFVEKPLCINISELIKIEKKYNQLKKNNLKLPILMVGFNRRFSPLIKELKSNLDSINEITSFIYTCNAGLIDKDNWIHERSIGGGRLLGEACHFLDLLRYLAGSQIQNLEIISSPELNYADDNFILQVKFENGSIGSINYFNNGDKSYPKEKLEVFSGGTIQTIENFRKLKVWGPRKFRNIRLIKQDKGQINCAKEFINSIKKDLESPIKINEIFEVQKWLLKISDKKK